MTAASVLPDTIEEIREELRRRARRDPLAEVYQPTERQEQVHQCRKRILVVQGANRAGKSTCLVAETLYYALHRNQHAEIPAGPLTIWYVMPSLGMFERVIYPILRAYLPEGAATSFRTRPNPVLTFLDGSVIHFLSADMQQRRLQGGKVHLIVMDETPNERAFDELVARIGDTRGRIILGFLPEEVSEWVEDRMVTPYLAGDKRDIAVVEMPLADEETDEPLVPWFTRTDILQMKRLWPDPETQAARIYGKRVRRKGLVYRRYDPGIHHLAEIGLPRHWQRWLICDPQYYRFGVLWFAADHLANYVVTDEFFSQEATLRERAERMWAITAARGDVAADNPLPVYVDSANQQDIAELNWHFDQLRIPLAALSLPFRKLVNVRYDESMVLRVHSLLEPDDERPYPRHLLPDEEEEIYGAPRLYFFDTLHSSWTLNGVGQENSRLFWELQQLTWGKDGKPDKKTAAGGELTDALNYGCAVMMRGEHPPRAARDAHLSQADRQLWDLIQRYDRRAALTRY
jgi:phage terminase large subunit-like protein